jgi:hypothetical protein
MSTSFALYRKTELRGRTVRFGSRERLPIKRWESGPLSDYGRLVEDFENYTERASGDRSDGLHDGAGRGV